MDAMLLAAGLGTRLRPLTERLPKPLIEIGGVPILERIARRLVAAGADRLIINLHHLGEQIRDFVAERDNFGVEVVYSEESERPLETGGGLALAAPLFRGDAPFFLHNTDILTDLPLGDMYAAHLAEPSADPPMATLAVMRRETSRFLLFDERGLLGRVDRGADLRVQVREAVGAIDELAFAGVHVVSPDIFERLGERGAFSILEPYLELAAEGRRIVPFRVDGSDWIDIGKPEQLEEARRSMERSLP